MSELIKTIKLIPKKHYDEYAIVMREIINRAHSIYSIYDKTKTTEERYLMQDIEFCSVQLRKILELLLLAIMVADPLTFRQQLEEYDEKSAGTFKLNELIRINCKCFPKPLEVISDHNNNQVRHIDSDHIFNEEDFRKAYKFASKYIHNQNIFRLNLYTVLDEYNNKLICYLNSLMNLLEKHKITLKNGDIVGCEFYYKNGDKVDIGISDFPIGRA